ncbi:hypothetical protein KL918_004726 [Ogataea parapolymorpha]|nr:hypothetical protein KL918_004726 [Ogataea parapolymorpha]KAG7872729.1 hypothetical protein KL916_002774 [Ogataea parapolymorpha]
MQLHLATARCVRLIRVRFGRIGFAPQPGSGFGREGGVEKSTTEVVGVQGRPLRQAWSVFLVGVENMPVLTRSDELCWSSVSSETSSQDGRNAKPGGGLSRQNKTVFPAKFVGQFLRGTNSISTKHSLILAVRCACRVPHRKLFLTSKDKQWGQSQLFD